MPCIYALEEINKNSKFYKVGAASNLKRRVQDIRRTTNGKLRVIYSKKFDYIEDAKDLEIMIHHSLDSYRISGRGREWYYVDREDLMRKIKDLVEPYDEQLYAHRKWFTKNERRGFEFFIKTDLDQKGITLRDGYRIIRNRKR